MTVIEYCTEEVERQGHDTSVLDGIERVGWMLEAWAYALLVSQNTSLRIGHIARLGEMIEPLKNTGGFRKYHEVRVGNYLAPPAIAIEGLLVDLLAQWSTLDALSWYIKFEKIHPFVDGNGRTGKILLNWKNGTLLDPIFPPADLFGEPIRNP